MSATRYYAFSHIHGDLNRLRLVLDEITIDLNEHKTDNYHVIMLGDFIDHGISSKKIVDFLGSSHPHSSHISTLMGDHECMLLGFIDCIEDGPLWLTSGGISTLHSYGIECYDYSEAIEELHIIQKSLEDTIPKKHLAFFHSLQPYLETEDFIFSHGGMNTTLPTHKNSLDELIWGDVKLEGTHNLQKTLVYIDDNSGQAEVAENIIALPGSRSKTCYVIQKDEDLRSLISVV